MSVPNGRLTTNGPLFRSRVEQHLAPVLKLGDIVVIWTISPATRLPMPNCAYLPPDLNPIELACSKLKKLLHDGAE